MTITPGSLRQFFPHLDPERITERGGGFWRDRELRQAIACTDREAYLLYRAAELLQPRYILEVGAYVGWSTAHLAAGACYPPIWTIDNFREASGCLREPSPAVEARFWENLARCGLSERVALIVGSSPDDLPPMPPGGWQLAFIDGWHQNGQPLRDVQAVAAACHPQAVLALHDTWLSDVAAAVKWLSGAGWRIMALPTPGALAFAYREPPAGWEAFVKEAQGG